MGRYDRFWAGADWSVAYNLISQSKLIETEYQGRYFYMRKLH